MQTAFIEKYLSYTAEAVGCLNQSERVLQQYTQGIPTDSEASAECLGEMKNSAREISNQLTR